MSETTKFSVPLVFVSVYVVLLVEDALLLVTFASGLFLTRYKNKPEGKILSLSCSSIICLSLSYDAFRTLSLPAL